jgi:hypothetical protein
MLQTLREKSALKQTHAGDDMRPFACDKALGGFLTS